jgi:ribosome maturation factor RimP
MDLKKIITDWTEQCIENEETFLVDVEIKGSQNNQKIQVFIDGDQSVDIEECTRINRKLSDMLEENDIIEGRYVIEVSSPGVARSLKYIRQYPKHKGRKLDIVTIEKNKYTGELLDVIDNEIVIAARPEKSKKAPADNAIKLAISDIDTAKVLIKF